MGRVLEADRSSRRPALSDRAHPGWIEIEHKESGADIRLVEVIENPESTFRGQSTKCTGIAVFGRERQAVASDVVCVPPYGIYALDSIDGGRPPVGIASGTR